MDKLDFYTVNIDYIHELQRIDPKIPNINYESHNKFVLGVLFRIHEVTYYAPISSFNKGQSTNELIFNNKGEAISSVRFSFMFPIPDDKVLKKEINKEKDLKYRRLLLDEWNYCNKHSDKFIAKAHFVYEKVVNEKQPFFIKNCCDFLKLESYVKEVYLKRKRLIQKGGLQKQQDSKLFTDSERELER